MKQKSKLSLLLALIAILLVAVLVLSACGKKDNNKTDEPIDNDGNNTQESNNDNGDNGDIDDNGGNGGKEDAKDQVEVNFDQNKAYSLDSLSTETFEVKVGDRSVDYTIKSTSMSEDGQYIELVIVAEGIEKTILLPVFETEELEIREDLMPLYNLFAQEGDKAFAVTLKGAYTPADGEKTSVALKALINVLQEEGVQFALLGEEPEQKVLAVCKDDKLSLDGVTIDLAKIKEIFSSLMEGIGFDFDLGDLDFGDFDVEFDEDTAPAGESDLDVVTYGELDYGDDGELEIEVGGSDDITYGADMPIADWDGEEEFDAVDVFEMLSGALDSIDAVLSNPVVKAMNVSFTKEDGVYTLNIDSKKLISILQIFFAEEEEEEEFGFNDVIDFLDTQLDGALKAGDIKFVFVLTLKENRSALDVNVKNTKSGSELSISLALDVAEQLYELPELSKEEKKGKDIEISIPVRLPQNNVEVLADIVIHTSTMFTEDASDYVTASVAFNGKEDAVRFVLSQGYVYLDASGLMSAFGAGDAYVAFYQAFELDGEPATLIDILPSLFENLTGGFDLGDLGGMGNVDIDEGHQGVYDPDFNDDVEYGDGSLFAYGYGCTPKGDALVFDIGATEQDLRDALDVYYYDEDDNQIPYADYTVEGFNGSVSYNGSITIVFDEDHKFETEVLIYNHATAQAVGVVVDPIRIELGASVEVAEEYLGAIEYMFDGSLYWEDWIDGFVIDEIGGAAVAEDTTFDQLGEAIEVKVTRTATGEQYTTYARVYDPENPKPLSMRCSQYVYVMKGYTESELREMLSVSIEYEDGTDTEVDDYEIVGGYTYGAKSVTVVWGDFRQEVPVMDYDQYGGGDDDTGDEDEDEIDWFVYLRTVDEDGEIDFDRIAAICQENKELIESVYTVAEGDKSVSLQIAINTADNKDVLAVLNLFFGVPTEDGWADLDESAIVAIASKDLADGFSKIVGVSFEDAIASLVLDVDLSWNEKLSLDVTLSNGADKVYAEIGVSFGMIDSVPAFVLSEEQIENAQPFDSLFTMLSMFMGF